MAICVDDFPCHFWGREGRKERVWIREGRSVFGSEREKEGACLDGDGQERI
jgi:hypothetical protein